MAAARPGPNSGGFGGILGAIWGLLQIFRGFPHVVPMGSLWGPHGVSMDLYGVSTGFGISMGSLWSPYGVFMGSLWCLYGV